MPSAALLKARAPHRVVVFDSSSRWAPGMGRSWLKLPTEWLSLAQVAGGHGMGRSWLKLPTEWLSLAQVAGGHGMGRSWLELPTEW